MQTTYRVSHLSDARQVATSLNIARRKTDALDLSDDQATLLVDRPADITGDLNLSGVYKVATIQVVGARMTGWAADTGTAKRTANATYGAGATLTFSATYVQAELTALATRLAAVETALQNATQTIKALKDDALTHGLIGA